MFIPKKTWDRASPSKDVKPIPSGYFLAKCGLTLEDIRENRLPGIAAGTNAALSNGLSLDLMRLVQQEPGLGPEVAAFIFNFLELVFPEWLTEAAVAKTLACLEENLNYVAGASALEAASFLHAPLQMPADVMEMAAVLGQSPQATTSTYKI